MGLYYKKHRPSVNSKTGKFLKLSLALQFTTKFNMADILKKSPEIYYFK